MKSKLSTLALALLLWSAVTAVAQPGTLYRGRLDPAALATGAMGGVRLERVEHGKLPVLPASFSRASSVYTDEIEWSAAGRDGKIRVVVAEAVSGKWFACADLDGDSKYQIEECGYFVPGKQEDSSDPEVRFSVPSRVGPFRRLPLVLMLPAVGDAGKDAGYPKLTYTSWVYARGAVDIAGQRTLITMGVSLSKGGLVDPRNTRVGLDGNGNGKIDGNGPPLESSVAENEDLVFKVGNRYVTVKSVDPATGDVVVEERSASDYITIDRVIGGTIPNFTFTDFDGRERKLSDFAGKYVLLDFWGTWCPPCLREIPFLKAAYEKLHERGFEIIGIDFEIEDDSPAGLAASLEKARKLVASLGVSWPQATPASTNDLTRRRFRVQGFPTNLLVGPDLTLRSVGANLSLRGENLLSTLEAMVPQK